MALIKKLEGFIDFILFIATLSLIIYGLTKGFNLIELSANLIYLFMMLIRYLLTVFKLIYRIE